MNPGWLAIDSKADPRALARHLADVHERVFTEGTVDQRGGRDVIAASWRRCQAQGIDVDDALPPVADPDPALARWNDQRLASAVLTVGKMMAGVGQASEQVLLFCDTEGTLVWLDAPPPLLHKAISVNLEPGSNWSERAAGTNAMGTALAAGHPLQVFGPEHYVRSVHDWACSAAPVRDPETARTLGVIDLSGPVKNASALSLGVAIAAARLVERQLAEDARHEAESLARRFGGRVGSGPGRPFALAGLDGRLLDAVRTDLIGSYVDVGAGTSTVVLPGGTRLTAEPLRDGRGFLLWSAGAGPAGAEPRDDRAGELRLEALGRARAVLHVDGVQHVLAPRQSEVLALLALRPSGWTAGGLAEELFGAGGNPVSVRVLMSKLRAILGDRLEGRPYRLAAELEADFVEVERRLAEGRVREALDGLGDGELLPGSESAVVAEARLRLTLALREAVMVSGDPSLLGRWLSLPAGEDDVLACRALMQIAPPSDPRYAMAAARLRRISATN